MKDRNGPATIARCKETGKCQFIDVINIFLFTVSLYLAGIIYTSISLYRGFHYIAVFIYSKLTHERGHERQSNFGSKTPKSRCSSTHQLL